MNKKTRNSKKLKKIKKGGLFSSLGKEGSFIPENIKYEVKMGHDNSLLDEYKIRKENAEKEYDTILKRYQQEDDEINAEDAKRNLSRIYFLRVQIFIFNIIKSFFSSLNIIINKVILITTNFAKGLYLTINLAARSFFNVADLGKGAIIKTIILILIILFCIGGTIGFFSNPGNASKFDFNNSTNMDFYFKTKSPSFVNTFSTTLMGFIPPQYQTNFTAFKNSFNKTLGNDLLANSRNKYNRENIGNKGRYDGIYHIKYDDNNKDRVYSSLKPGDIKWNLEINNYKNTDFYKLPANIQSIYNTSNNTDLTIPAKIENGQYQYKLENSAYFGNDIKKTVNQTNFPYKDDTSSIYGSIFTLNNFDNNKNIFKDSDKDFGKNIKNSFDFDTNGNTKYPIEYIKSKLETKL